MCGHCLKTTASGYTPLLRGSLSGARGGALHAAPVGPTVPSLCSRPSQGQALVPAAAPCQEKLPPRAGLSFSVWFLRRSEDWHRCPRGNPPTPHCCCCGAGGPGQPPGWACLCLPWEQALPYHRREMGLLRGFCPRSGWHPGAQQVSGRGCGFFACRPWGCVREASCGGLLY